MKTIAIFNQKGGVGKTTTAISLAYAFRNMGFKVLLIDLDPQANATLGLGIKENPSNGIYSVLMGSSSINSTIVELDGLALLPASLSLADAELELSNALSRELVLDRVLKKVGDAYDLAIIDCPPNLGLLSINALSTANRVLVPIYPSFYSIQGLASFIKYFSSIKSTINPELEILGYVITKYDERKNIHKSIVKELEEQMGADVLTPYIRTNSKLEESQEQQISIFDLDPKNKGSEDYYNLAREILRRME